MKTLADMTKEDRDKCLGKWCYVIEQFDELPIYDGIITGYQESDNDRILAVIDDPHPDAGKEEFDLNKIIPRDDLPRAWNPDGRPPKGKWFTAKKKLRANNNLTYDPENKIMTGDAVADPDHEPREDHDIRCWISEWETIEKEEQS